MNGCVVRFGLTSIVPNVCVNFFVKFLWEEIFSCWSTHTILSCRIDSMTCRNQNLQFVKMTNCVTSPCKQKGRRKRGCLGVLVVLNLHSVSIGWQG